MDKQYKQALMRKSLGEMPAMIELRSDIQARLEGLNRQLCTDRRLINDKETMTKIWAEKDVYQWFLSLFTRAEKKVEAEKLVDISPEETDNI